MPKTSLEEQLVSLEPLFNPRSIAIIGASRDPGKPSGQPLVALLENGFPGRVFPVNPNYQELQGLKCYPALLDVPEKVDLAIIAVAAPYTLEALRDCVRKRVKAAIVFTSGFAEVGEEGRRLQEEMGRLARGNGLRICGPNCLGIFSAHNALMANFGIKTLPERVIKPDFLGFITQSGGFGYAIYEMIKERGIGFSHFVSTGNEADVDFAEYLAYMAKDAYTRVIGGYLEGVKNGEKLVRATEMAMAAGKPVVLIKTGRYPAAARAAVSHTGALVGSEKVFSAFCRQKGVIRTESIEELAAVLSLLLGGNFPAGNRVGILAFSGGIGVLLADKCIEYGLDVVTLAQTTRTRLETLLPSFASSANPVDITSQVITHPGLVRECAEIMLADPQVDNLILCFSATARMLSTLEQLVQVARGTTKTVLNIIIGPEEVAREAIGYLHARLIPAVKESEFGAKALGALAGYAARTKLCRSGGQPPPVPAGAQETVAALLRSCQPGTSLTEFQAKQVLRAYGIPVPEEALAGSPAEAVAISEKIGYPVALKIDSPAIVHKTEVGGVRLTLENSAQVQAAYREILANVCRCRTGAEIRGVLVQKMFSGGIETVIGVAHDSIFGPVVMFGLGGIWVEALNDVALRLVPLKRSDAGEMVREIRGYRVLQGLRGNPPADVAAVVEVILKISRLVTDFPTIKEVDINPLLVFEQGVRAVDALLVVGPER